MANQSQSWARRVVAGCLSLGLMASAWAQVDIDRLTLFVNHGSDVAQHTVPGGAAANNLDFSALGIDARVSEDRSAQGDRQWTWLLTNTSSQALTDVRISSFLDADIQAGDNTFFNEAATSTTWGPAG